MTGIGRKILIKAETEVGLCQQLRLLISDIEGGHVHVNVERSGGIRIMRLLNKYEMEDSCMNAEDLK